MKLLLLSNFFFSVCVLTGCTDLTPKYAVGRDKNTLSKNDAELSFARQVTDKPSFSDGGNTLGPKVLSSRFPDYPQSWRNANIVGTVVVRFSVETDGSVSNPAVLGSPSPELAAISLQAIMRWKFTPATREGKPIKVTAQQSFEFKTERYSGQE